MVVSWGLLVEIVHKLCSQENNDKNQFPSVFFPSRFFLLLPLFVYDDYTLPFASIAMSIDVLSTKFRNALFCMLSIVLFASVSYIENPLLSSFSRVNSMKQTIYHSVTSAYLPCHERSRKQLDFLKNRLNQRSIKVWLEERGLGGGRGKNLVDRKYQ